jgi:hypothetical protein
MVGSFGVKNVIVEETFVVFRVQILTVPLLYVTIVCPLHAISHNGKPHDQHCSIDHQGIIMMALPVTGMRINVDTCTNAYIFIPTLDFIEMFRK